MSWLISLFMRFYQVKDSDLPEKNLFIVPHGYGLLSPSRLPDAEGKVLEEAARIAKGKRSSKIIFASADYFWQGCKKQEDDIKLSFLRQRGVAETDIVAVKKGIVNTIQEVEVINRYIPSNVRVVIVADWMHSRSVKAIWRKLAGREVFVRSVKGDWTSEHPAVLQKSTSRWLFANLARHLLFAIFGKRIAKLRHVCY